MKKLCLFDKIKNIFKRRTPKTKKELKEMIKSEIEKNGIDCSLNHIDVSEIEDMSELFYKSDFNGDISKWDVSHVKDMSYMFYEATSFDQDLSSWNVSNATDIESCFEGTPIENKVKMWFPEFHI